MLQKWLKVGILENRVVTISEGGTGQGSVASPLLANVYLHYVFDLWAERWRRCEASGDMIIARYADDIIIGFEHETDARRFWDAMRERLAARYDDCDHSFRASRPLVTIDRDQCGGAVRCICRSQRSRNHAECTGACLDDFET